MRDMDNSPNNEIKLFGTTITIHDRKQQKHTHTSDNDTTQQTGEMKRPDKIIPCPRCKSMDTKFCYFNNYNVNQPRHFCKGCQRYWTAGGSIRNVPVGAGRRKHKTIPSGTGFSDISCGLYDANPSAVQHYFNLQGAVGMENSRHLVTDSGFQKIIPAMKRRRNGEVDS